MPTRPLRTIVSRARQLNTTSPTRNPERSAHAILAEIALSVLTRLRLDHHLPRARTQRHCRHGLPGMTRSPNCSQEPEIAPLCRVSGSAGGAGKPKGVRGLVLQVGPARPDGHLARASTVADLLHPWGYWRRVQTLRPLVGRRTLRAKPQRRTLSRIGLVTFFATQGGIPAVACAAWTR